MTKRFDVIALGELLIDFTENGQSEQGNSLMEANPGGAPCNVLAMLKKLGYTCAFIGKVGDDMFGRQLKQVTEDAGICMDYLQMDRKIHTTLAFVKTFPNGDRDFSFYRNPGADMMLEAKELPVDAIQNCRIFHFGSLSMTHEDVRFATKKAVGLAKSAGALISFDPNLRPPLWDSLEEAREQIAWGLSRCDILKIADNELEFMTGETNFEMLPQVRKAATATAERKKSLYPLSVWAEPLKQPVPVIPSVHVFFRMCWKTVWKIWAERESKTLFVLPMRRPIW